MRVPWVSFDARARGLRACGLPPAHPVQELELQRLLGELRRNGQAAQGAMNVAVSRAFALRLHRLTQKAQGLIELDPARERFHESPCFAGGPRNMLAPPMVRPRHPPRSSQSWPGAANGDAGGPAKGPARSDAANARASSPRRPKCWGGRGLGFLRNTQPKLPFQG